MKVHYCNLLGYHSTFSHTPYTCFGLNVHHAPTCIVFAYVFMCIRIEAKRTCKRKQMYRAMRKGSMVTKQIAEMDFFESTCFKL